MTRFVDRVTENWIQSTMYSNDVFINMQESSPTETNPLGMVFHKLQKCVENSLFHPITYLPPSKYCSQS